MLEVLEIIFMSDLSSVEKIKQVSRAEFKDFILINVLSWIKSNLLMCLMVVIIQPECRVLQSRRISSDVSTFATFLIVGGDC